MKTRIQVEIEVSLVTDTKGLAQEQGISYSQFVQNALAHTLIVALQGESIDELGIVNEVAPEPSPETVSAPEPKVYSAPSPETVSAPDSPQLYRRDVNGLHEVKPGDKLWGDELLMNDDKTEMLPYKPSKS